MVTDGTSLRCVRSTAPEANSGQPMTVPRTGRRQDPDQRRGRMTPRVINEMLGVDGVDEAAVYMVAVGHRRDVA